MLSFPVVCQTFSTLLLLSFCQHVRATRLGTTVLCQGQLDTCSLLNSRFQPRKQTFLIKHLSWKKVHFCVKPTSDGDSTKPKDSNNACYDTPGCFHTYKTAILYPLLVLHPLQPGHSDYYRDTMHPPLLATALYAIVLPSPQVNSDCDFVAIHSVR